MVKCSSGSLNRTFVALPDPTRRRIREHLAHGDRSVTDLARPHRMSLPAVSQHLSVLERAGLIRRSRASIEIGGQTDEKYPTMDRGVSPFLGGELGSFGRLLKTTNHREKHDHKK